MPAITIKVVSDIFNAFERAMLILLFGEDTYRSKQKLKEIISDYNQSHQGGLEHLDATQLDYREFKDQVRQSSMFVKKKLVILSGAFSDKEFRDKFLEDADHWNESDDIILLYEDDKVSKRTSLFKFIKSNAQWEQFEQLEGKELKKWVSEQFQEQNTEINKKALSTLVNFVGNDLWRFSNEIEKLVNYKNQARITEEDVKLLVKPDLETDIFKTVDAFALKDKQQALDLIQEHLDQGDSALYLLHMINYQLRNLLTVKQLNQRGKSFSSIKQKTDLHPYVVKKSLRQCKNFTLEEIKKIYHQLLEVDLSIKTGKVDPEPGLKSLVARI